MTPQEELADIREQIKALEARRRAIYAASLEDEPTAKVCPDYLAEALAALPPFPHIEYPITVHGIDCGTAAMITPSWDKRNVPGTWVAIQPCAEEYADKGTMLGLMVGDVAHYLSASWNAPSGILHLDPGTLNPCVWVPEVGKFIYGRESNWRAIKSPKDLKQITDADIDNVWYMRALKSLEGAP